MKAGRLPVMKYKGKYWYIDNRLEQIRNINDFSDSEEFDEIEHSKIENPEVPWEEAQKHETWQNNFQ
ncbi:MAG: hypothetical protein ACMXYA_01470 [Candidatus Woesearchaeota archaeon]